MAWPRLRVITALGQLLVGRARVREERHDPAGEVRLLLGLGDHVARHVVLDAPQLGHGRPLRGRLVEARPEVRLHLGQALRAGRVGVLLVGRTPGARASRELLAPVGVGVVVFLFERDHGLQERLGVLVLRLKGRREGHQARRGDQAGLHSGVPPPSAAAGLGWARADRLRSAASRLRRWAAAVDKGSALVIDSGSAYRAAARRGPQRGACRPHRGIPAKRAVPGGKKPVRNRLGSPRHDRGRSCHRGRPRPPRDPLRPAPPGLARSPRLGRRARTPRSSRESRARSRTASASPPRRPSTSTSARTS